MGGGMTFPADFWRDLGTFVGAATVPMFGYLVVLGRRILFRMKSDDGIELASFGLNIEHASEITAMLAVVQSKIGAKRVHLSKFHNGEKFVDGSEIIRFSRTHEWARPGSPYQMEIFQGMLLSSVPNEMKLVMAPGASFTVVSDLPECKFRWLCEGDATAAVARCSIFAGTHPVAFVGADFDTVEPPENMAELVKLARDIGIKIALWEQAKTKGH
jgi:hypothetical protein